MNACWPDVPLQNANLKISELIERDAKSFDSEEHPLHWYMKHLIEVLLQKDSTSLEILLDEVLVKIDMENQLHVKENGELHATGRCLATFLSSLLAAVNGRKPDDLFSDVSISFLQHHLQTLRVGEHCLGFVRPTHNLRFGSTDA